MGVSGQHLYQVLVPMDPFEPAAYELAESEIEPIHEPAGKGVEVDMERVINYLKKGGLISILRSNGSGGRSQPRVWLCLDSLGNVTHTFIKERGQLGGESVPFMAYREDRVFAPSRNEVTEFLGGFGLNTAQVEDVLETVGTFPK